MPFPESRPRRLRRTESIRALVRETVLTVDDLIWPIFIEPGAGVRKPIVSMPGQFRYSVDTAVEAVTEAWNLGVKAVILFGIPTHKDPLGTRAYAKDGVA